MNETPDTSGLQFGDMLPDPRTPIERRADSVAETIDTLLADPALRNDVSEWRAVLRARHALPEAELRGFDAMLRRELVDYINAHAAALTRPTSANAALTAAPLNKTTAAAIFEEMAWWGPPAMPQERYAQIQWLRQQLHVDPLRQLSARKAEEIASVRKGNIGVWMLIAACILLFLLFAG